jgi:alpha-ribazole phosphatase
MEIHVIRHTAPDVPKGVCYGYTDIPLLPSFAEETQTILSAIPDDIEMIYTSPLSRCRKLADKLSEAKRAPMQEDIRLKELNFGHWEMQRWEDIDSASLLKWMSNYEEECCPNGESYRQLVNRVDDFLTTISHAHYKRIAIVTHGGVIKAMHALINKLTLKDAMARHAVYGEITIFNL